MSPSRIVVLLVGLVLAGLALGRLEAPRGGLIIEHTNIGATPVTVARLAGAAPAPAVVIAHGFAGSRQIMQAFTFSLAQAGYVAVSFDFEGHGRHPDPMSGDVTSVDGTTTLLMDQTQDVIDFALEQTGVDGRVALLGHSMASDIIVRQALRDPRVGPVVAISMFSAAVTDQQPAQLLAISGVWEGMLRAEALRVAQLVDPTALEGQTVLAAAPDGSQVIRRAAVAPGVEHVGVLYSTTALAEAKAWLNARFEREATGPLARIGGPIALLLAALLAIAWPLSARLREGPAPHALWRLEFWIAALTPAIVTPLLLAPFETRILPVLVADYLTLHLLVYGVLTLLILRGFGHRIGRVHWATVAFLALYGIGVFGVSLDRYVSSFMPAGPRLFLIIAIAVGTIPYMVGEARLLEAGRAGLGYAFAARFIFLCSLGMAVVLDFERLFFLLIILPVIVLFFAIFGTMGGWAGRRSGSVAGVGVGLGIVLAWSLGVTFPMFLP